MTDEIYSYLVSSMQGLRNLGSNSGPDSSYSEDSLVLLAHRLTSLAISDPENRNQIIKEYPKRLIQIYDIVKGKSFSFIIT
jgi:hypothetical protein